MPKIIDYEQRTTTPTGLGAPMPHAEAPSGLAALANATAGSLHRVSKGLSDAAEAQFTVQEEEARAWSSSVLSDAKLKWTQTFIERQAAAPPNAPEFTPSLLKDFDEYANDTISKAPTAAAKRYLTARLGEFRTSLGEQALGFEAKARMDWRADQFSVAIDNTSKLMNTDPGQYKVSLAERLAEIDSSSMPPVQKSALRQKAIDTISEAAVWSQVQRSPSAFLDSIGFGGGKRQSSGDLNGVTGNAAFDALPFDKRAQMFQQAIRHKAQIDMDVDKAAKAEADRLQDEAMKNIWSKQASGTLRMADIEAARPLLKADQYHSALRALKGEAGQKTDPSTFSHLQRLIVDGDYAEAERFAFKAHANGLLSNADLSSEVNRARSQSRQEGPKSAYERGTQYITTSLDPGPFVQDPLGKARWADAKRDFDHWVMAGKRTDEEIDKKSQEIVKQYKFIDMRDTLLGLPQPVNAQLPRNAGDPGAVMDAIAAASLDLQRKLDAGAINKQQYETDIKIIARWLKAVRGEK